MTKKDVVISSIEFPDIDENGFQKVMSGEGEVVYAKYTNGGCEKRVIKIDNGVTVNDTTEFQQGAYIKEWTCNGVPFRYELIGG
jgi:hypothetical protein